MTREEPILDFDKKKIFKVFLYNYGQVAQYPLRRCSYRKGNKKVSSEDIDFMFNLLYDNSISRYNKLAKKTTITLNCI